MKVKYETKRFTANEECEQGKEGNHGHKSEVGLGLGLGLGLGAERSREERAEQLTGREVSGGVF